MQKKKTAANVVNNDRSRKSFALDFWMLFSVIVLVVIGVTMLFSASAPYAMSLFDDSRHFFKNQLKFALIGLIVMLVASRIDYHIYRGKLSLLAIAVSIVLLILVRLPGIGFEENGAWRWIGLGSFSFQPSEIAKISLIVFLADRLSRNRKKPELNLKDVFPYFMIIALFSGLFMIEPHLSCTVITIMVSMILLLCAGTKLIYFITGAGAGVAAIVAAVSFLGYARERIEFFLDPYKDPLDSGYQIIQSLLAIGSGGLFGRGIGKSIQKFLYLPESQNDFIFAILAEELGFIGVIGVIAVFMVLFFRGMKVSMQAADLYGSLLAVGITSLIAIQTFLNIMVVTKLIPSTGVSLPFFSAGGTSLVILMGSVGILLNVSRYSQYKKI